MDIEEIIKQIKAEDTEALKILVETYSPMVRKVCFNITKEDEDTLNDLVQVVFIRAFYSLHQLRDASKFGEWICTIAKNEALKYQKYKKKTRTVPLSSFTGEELEIEGGMTPENILDEKEILEIIDQLPKGYRRIFQMAEIEGYSHKEIAAKLGIESHSSSSQLTRAKEMLRKMINKRMMTFIAIILVCMPMFRLLWKKDKTEYKSVNTSQVENENDVQIKNGKRQKEEPQSHKKSEMMLAAEKKNEINQNIAQTRNDSISAIDTLNIKKTLENSNIVIIEDDSITIDTIRNIWHENNKQYIAKDSDPAKKHEWQLLAAGSLGATLVQNAYKIFTGNAGGDIDGSQPSVPETFSTWEEYYQYLQENVHGNMSKEEEALMEIAKNNNGKIMEHEHHYKPMTIGLSLTKKIGNKWYLETGLQYSFLRSDYTLGEGAYYIQKKQKLHYLGMPLRISYQWFNVKKWSAYLSTGVILNIPVYGKINERYVTGQQMPYKDSRDLTAPFQWSVGTSVGMQYQFAPNWGVYLEPSLNWYIPNGSSVHTTWTEHPLTFTIPFGIRFTW